MLTTALCSPADFYYFFAWTVSIDGYRVRLADHALVSSLLEELTAVAGCEDRAWVVDPAPRYRDDFLLSGMDVGGRSVWRLAAQNMTALAAADGHVRASPVSVCMGAVVRTCVATACSLVFDHGVVLPRGNHTAGEIVYNVIAPVEPPS